MKKIEMEEIRAYIINYANAIWNRNRSFVDIYGIDYVRNQLQQNLSDVAINRSTEDPNVSAEYNLITRKVYLYNSDCPIYSVRDLKKSPSKSEILMSFIHEFIHAILAQNLWEEPRRRMTGIEIYDEQNGVIINTALNEGYTEYLRYLLDKKRQCSYKPYFKVFEILRKKLGAKGIVALSKGNIAQNMADAFNMTREEFIEFSRTVEKNFIRERKVEVLVDKFNQFMKKCQTATEETRDIKSAIIKFDKSVYKSLYKESMMDNWPDAIAEYPTLSDVKQVVMEKNDSVRNQSREVYLMMYSRAYQACDKSMFRRTVDSIKMKFNMFMLALTKTGEYEKRKRLASGRNDKQYPFRNNPIKIKQDRRGAFLESINARGDYKKPKQNPENISSEENYMTVRVDGLEDLGFEENYMEVRFDNADEDLKDNYMTVKFDDKDM